MRTACPLYTWAGSPTYITRIAELHAGDVAIVTGDNSGPGTVVDPNLTQRIADLTAKGVDVLGYVDVAYGARRLESVLDDLAKWHGWYGVTRPFFDDWPKNWGARYIGAMWGAVRGYSGRGTPERPILTVNPGTLLALTAPPPAGTLIVEHEGSTFPTATPHPWSVALVWGQADPAATRAALDAAGWQFGYVTSDGADGNPYDEATVAS